MRRLSDYAIPFKRSFPMASHIRVATTAYPTPLTTSSAPFLNDGSSSFTREHFDKEYRSIPCTNRRLASCSTSLVTCLSLEGDSNLRMWGLFPEILPRYLVVPPSIKVFAFHKADPPNIKDFYARHNIFNVIYHALFRAKLSQYIPYCSKPKSYDEYGQRSKPSPRMWKLYSHDGALFSMLLDNNALQPEHFTCKAHFQRHFCSFYTLFFYLVDDKYVAAPLINAKLIIWKYIRISQT